METDYESLPSQPRKRPTTYGKKARNRANLQSSNRQVSSSQQQQENQGAHIIRRTLSRAHSQVQLGKRTRSKTEEKEERSGGSDASGESSDSEPVVGAYRRLPPNKKPRASSHPPSSTALSSPAPQPMSTSNSLFQQVDRIVAKDLTRTNSEFSTSKKLPPVHKKATKAFARMKSKSRSLDDTRSSRNTVDMEGVRESSPKDTQAEKEELEKEKALQTMLQYVVMDEVEDLNPFSPSQLQSSQRLPRATQLASVSRSALAVGSPATSLVLGDKSNLPRIAQQESLPHISYSQSSTSTPFLTSVPKKKSSNLLKVGSASSAVGAGLKIYRDSTSTSRHFNSTESKIRRVSSLTSNSPALDLASLSNALLSAAYDENKLQVPSSHVRSLNTAAHSPLNPLIIRQSSLPLPASSFPLSHTQNQFKSRPAILPIAAASSGVVSTRNHRIVDTTSLLPPTPQPVEGSASPISQHEMDSSMIVESFDDDDDQDEVLEFGGGGEREDAKVIRLEEEVDDEMSEVTATKVRNCQMESGRSEQEVGVEEIVSEADPLIDEVQKRLKRNKSPIVEGPQSLESNKLLNTERSIIASPSPKSYRTQPLTSFILERKISPPSSEQESLDPPSSSLRDSSTDEEFSFTLPPRALSSSRVDPPTTSGFPLANEDELAYLIRTTSTGEVEELPDEFDEMEIGEGFRPGSTIDSAGVGRRMMMKAKRKRERDERERLKNQILVNALEGGETDDELMI